MMLNNKQSHRQPEREVQNTEISTILDSLAIKSQQTLEQILDNTEISLLERAEIALKILQIANNQKSNSIISVPLINNSEQKKIAQFPINSINAFQTEPQKQSVSDMKKYSCNYLQIDNFLSQEEYQRILATALNKESDFKDSRTITNAENYRKSLILPATKFEQIYYFVKNQILEKFPSILQQLKYPEFSVSQMEMQMTAHNDGAFYKVHTDAGSEQTKTRELTYVYYFYQEPKQFSGGELKIYDTEIQGKKIIQKENSVTVEPRNNSIVFFNSRCNHEVLPISCSSQKFIASRFTLNGWLRR